MFLTVFPDSIRRKESNHFAGARLQNEDQRRVAGVFRGGRESEETEAVVACAKDEVGVLQSQPRMQARTKNTTLIKAQRHQQQHWERDTSKAMPRDAPSSLGDSRRSAALRAATPTAHPITPVP